MPAVKNLPDNYHNAKTLDLSGSKVILWMNIAAIPLLFIYGWLFYHLITLKNPLIPNQVGIYRLFTAFSLLELFLCILTIVVMLVLHELVHGIFFYLFTREKPEFAIKPGYAYAAAPEWYFSKFQYVMVGLAPLLIISFASLFVAAGTTSTIMPYFLIIATFNAAGSLGDVIVVVWILHQPKNILVSDKGDVFITYSLDKV
jgi:hypothetical protein